MQWSYPLLARHKCEPSKGFTLCYWRLLQLQPSAFRNFDICRHLSVWFLSTPLPPHPHSSGKLWQQLQVEALKWACQVLLGMETPRPSDFIYSEYLQSFSWCLSPPVPWGGAEASPDNSKAHILCIWTLYMIICQWLPESEAMQISYLGSPVGQCAQPLRYPLGCRGTWHIVFIFGVLSAIPSKQKSLCQIPVTTLNFWKWALKFKNNC